jgi:hypothetical protein
LKSPEFGLKFILESLDWTKMLTPQFYESNKNKRNSDVKKKKKAIELIQNKEVSLENGLKSLEDLTYYINEQDTKTLFPILQEYLFNEQEELRNISFSCFLYMKKPESPRDVHTTLIKFFEKYKTELDEEKLSNLVVIFSNHLKDEIFILESLDFLSFCLEKNFQIQNGVSEITLNVINEKNMDLLLKKNIISKFIQIFVKRNQESISMENISLKKTFELILKIESSRNLFDEMKGSKYLAKHQKLKYIHDVFGFGVKKKILSLPISIHKFDNITK